jgi:hypothetical protein
MSQRALKNGKINRRRMEQVLYASHAGQDVPMFSRDILPKGAVRLIVIPNAWRQDAEISVVPPELLIPIATKGMLSYH